MRLKRAICLVLIGVLLAPGVAVEAPASAHVAATGNTGPEDPVDLVNVFTGTLSAQPDYGTGGGAGNTFPGAVAPFGMLQWSPDTMPSLDNFAARYTYTDSVIRGFSLTHLSGAGCAGYGDVPILPIPGTIDSSPIDPSSSEYRAELLPSFDHAHESATPGQYAVTLDPGTKDAVDVDLAARTRSGAGRFRFSGDQGTFLVNAGGSSMADTQASVDVDPARRTITGTSASGAFCYQDSRYTVHFAITFDRPFAAHGTWTRSVLSPGSTSATDVGADPRTKYQQLPGGPKQLPGDPSGTAQAGAYVTFDTSAHHEVGARVAISFVSVDNARENLRHELGGRSFGRVRTLARDAWERELSRIEVRGNSLEERRTFYTALYHALIHPSTFDDVDGSYLGMDGAVHHTSRTKYANFSGWDVYRSQVPLLAMVWPRRAADLAQSLVLDARQSGWLPKWPVAASHTGMMVGDPASITLASIDALGVRRFDRRTALDAMVKGATQVGRSMNSRYVERPGMEDYLTSGYVPYERDTGVYSTFIDPGLVWGPTATTLEYAVADFATARLAAELCRRAGDCRPERRAIAQRSASWRNVIDPDTHVAQSRSVTGAWVDQDPSDGSGFVEGNGAQYTWLVPQDPAGLFTRLGGHDAALEQLNKFFTKLNAGPAAPYAFLGNEPTSGAPYLFHWLGRPAGTQRVVDQALTDLYGATPDGLPGNDDLGQMSAWYVLNAIGLYPAVPGTDVLAVLAPRFRHVTLHLPGKDLSIALTGALGGSGRTVRSVHLDGRSLRRSWLQFGDLRCGGHLDVQIGEDDGWGSAPRLRPPSFGPDSTGRLLPSRRSCR